MKLPPVITRSLILAVMLMCVGGARAQDPSPECATRAIQIRNLESWQDAQPVPVTLVQAVLDALTRKQANECVRLNQVQLLGTHNSYHRQPSQPLLDALTSITSAAQAWE